MITYTIQDDNQTIVLEIAGIIRTGGSTPGDTTLVDGGQPDSTYSSNIDGGTP